MQIHLVHTLQCNQSTSQLTGRFYLFSKTFVDDAQLPLLFYPFHSSPYPFALPFTSLPLFPPLPPATTEGSRVHGAEVGLDFNLYAHHIPTEKLVTILTKAPYPQNQRILCLFLQCTFFLFFNCILSVCLQ